MDFLQAAIAKADQPGDEEHRAGMLARLSRAYMRLGRSTEAVARADEALAIAEPRRPTRIIAEASVNKSSADARFMLALTAHLLRDRDMAREGVELAGRDPFAGTFVEAMQDMARAGWAALEGRSEEALASYRRSVDALATGLASTSRSCGWTR